MKFSLTIFVAAVFSALSVAIAQDPSALAPELSSGEWTYEVRGSGESILFIHGGLIAGPSERFLTQEAFADYQLIAYHRRGYSGSPFESGPADDYVKRHAADAAALLRHLRVSDAHVVGHSSGGTIALELAVSNPELVESLVLLEPVVPVPETASNSQLNAASLAEAEALIQANEFVAVLDMFMQTAAGLPQWRTLNTADEVRQAEAYAPTFFLYEGPSLSRWLPPQGPVSEELAVLYISGSESPHPTESVGIVKAWFPQTVELEIPAVSHGLYTEDPESVAEEIAEFVRRL